MKRVLTLALAGLLAASLSVAASAYWEPEEAFGEVKFSIGKQTTAWNADGVISEGEYYRVALDPSWISYAINDNDTDAGLAYAKSVTPELYMSWDEDNIYCATRYEVPEGHENLWDGDPASMWYSGAVQFNYANFDEVASEYRLEYGVGLSSDTGDLLYTVWADGAGSGFTPSEENAKVWLDGNTLTYETKVAWDDFADEMNTAGQEGLGFNFCLVWSIGKGQDYVHIQLAEGCTGNGKHAENFAQVTLAPAPASPVTVLHGTPAVDGKLDDAYLKSGSLELENPGFYVWAGDEEQDETATVYYLWDEANLYVIGVVKDNDVLDVGAERYEDQWDNWQAEAVENWFNVGEGKWKTHADAFGHTFYAKDNGNGAEPPFDYEEVKYAATQTDDGYIVEYALPIPGMGVGAVISTSVQVNDQCTLDDEYGTGYASGSQNADHPLELVAEEAAPSYSYPASGADGSIINGTVIGNATGWGDNADAGAAAAFDGNPATFFDPLGVGDGFCGMDAGESYILDKVAVLSRSGFLDRFAGAMIQGSNDGENWTTLWTSDTQAASETEYTIITEFENNTGYSQFRYFNETNHGDVAEVEFYGTPGKTEALPGFETADEAVASIGKTAIAGYTFVEGTNGNNNEGPENLWDGDTATKFCTGEFPISSTAELDGWYKVDGIVMATANDNAEYNGRLPSAWTVSGSADGENWTVIASGDESFFDEVNFRYFAGDASSDATKFVKFDAEGASSGCFQISELVLTGGRGSEHLRLRHPGGRGFRSLPRRLCPDEKEALSISPHNLP